MFNGREHVGCELAVIWIDWYAYHVARFIGLNETPSLAGKVVGLEMVSGAGVHPGLRFRQELPAGLAIETLMPGVGWSEASKLRLAMLLWNRLNVLRPRTVLVPGYYTLPAIAAALWARAHGRCSVLMSESTAFDHERHPGRELLKRIVIRALFEWAVAGGKAHVRYLEQLGFPAARIASSYDVVDNDAIWEGTENIRRARTVSGQTSPYFLFVGRLAPEKNVLLLLHSWLRYREEGGRWPLVLAGDGSQRSLLQAIAKRSRFSEEAQFTGLKSLRELLPLYAGAGCFVLPSRREPWGLVVNEAMAAELPVLVSRRCGCCEDLLREGENGFSFDPADAPALTCLLHAMERLSPEERTRMGRRSGEIIAAYTPRDFGRSVASIACSSDAADRLDLLSEAAQ